MKRKHLITIILLSLWLIITICVFPKINYLCNNNFIFISILIVLILFKFTSIKFASWINK